MEKSEILAKVIHLGSRIFEKEGIEMVHVDLNGQHGGWLLRFYIDRPGGVTLMDCQKVSEQVGAELDAEDLVPGSYTLEVSSPGLDRPLRKEEDFYRFRGRLVAISTLEPISGQRHFVGHLKSYEEGIVTVAEASGREHTIPKAKISSARLEVEV